MAERRPQGETEGRKKNRPITLLIILHQKGREVALHYTYSLEGAGEWEKENQVTFLELSNYPPWESFPLLPTTGKRRSEREWIKGKKDKNLSLPAHL